MESPIFVFSLPRSGSTLLQRVLMSHKDICSLSEPWILLPQIYALKSEGCLSEYSSYTANTGIVDFIENLPRKEADYLESLKDFIHEIYTKQCKNGERYFLDKTPRYYLIIDDIVKLFPDAKFIFLFRNPIHVYASIVNTWGNNRFNKLLSTYDDIKMGTPRLSEAYLKYKEKSIAVKYEEFVSNPFNELQRIFEYLQLDPDYGTVTNFNKQNTKGQLGDPTGVHSYSKISQEGLNKWEKTFNSWVRKRFAIQMVKKLRKEDLLIQGYNKNNMIQDIKSLDNGKNKFIIRDSFDYFVSLVTRRYKLHLMINKDFSWVKKRYLS